MQYRHDVCRIAHYHNRKYIRTYTRCSENHRNTFAENQNFDTQ